MGLLDLFHRLQRAEIDCRVLVLGLDNAGKTSILKKLFNEDVYCVTSTKGFYVRTHVIHERKLSFCDIGGNYSVRPYWKNYYAGASALIYVIDGADRRRLEESGVELWKILDEGILVGVPLLILVNKQDVLNAMSSTAISAGLNLHNIRDRRWLILNSCSRTGEGIDQGLEFLLHELKGTGRKRG